MGMSGENMPVIELQREKVFLVDGDGKEEEKDDVEAVRVGELMHFRGKDETKLMIDFSHEDLLHTPFQKNDGKYELPEMSAQEGERR